MAIEQEENVAEVVCATNDALRQQHYNATATSIKRIHDDLMILRARLDGEPLEFTPGQYAVLGLGYWEPRIAETQIETDLHEHREKLIKRAYSISCRLLDEDGRLAQTNEGAELEFYIALVRQAEEPPALTPRLFRLQTGERLYVRPRALGKYVLPEVQPDDQIIFAATGTGEAPHNSMVAQLLGREHRGPIASICCVRYRKDLGYLQQHRQLERSFANYRYVPLTTREPENVDPARTDFVGKRYLQDIIVASDFSDRTGCDLTPENTHVFLCGSPAMIGASKTENSNAVRRTPGMTEVLESRGFEVHKPSRPGQIHFERYW